MTFYYLKVVKPKNLEFGVLSFLLGTLITYTTQVQLQIIVFVSKVRQEILMCPSSLGSTLKVLGLESRVPPMKWVPGLGSRVSGLIFRVQGLWSRISPMRWVPGLGSQAPPKVSGLGYHFLDMTDLSTIVNYFSPSV